MINSFKKILLGFLPPSLRHSSGLPLMKGFLKKFLSGFLRILCSKNMR